MDLVIPEIARKLGIRPATVKKHLGHLYEKTGIRGRCCLVLLRLKEGGILTAKTAARLKRHSRNTG
jgi:DNA-binding NarL/FixJ family response regulator